MGKVSGKVTDPSGAVIIGANSVLFQSLLTADIDKEPGFRHTYKVGKTIYFDYCQAAPQ
jgi:hypothetical protein